MAPRAGKPDRARCGTNLFAKLAQHCARHFELFGLSLRQLLRNCLQTVVGAPHESGSSIVKSRAGEHRLELALRFGEFCKDNFFRRNTAELADEAEFGKSPDHPLGGIDLPWLHAVAVVVLELVMIIMVAFAQGNDCHKPRVTGAASGGIRAFTHIVAERIDAKGAVLKNDDACHPRNEECTEGRDPAAPGEAQDRWKYESDRYGDQVDVAILPRDERIFLQVGHIIERRQRVKLEHQPAHVSMKKSLRKELSRQCTSQEEAI